MLKEFKEFALKGSLIDTAIAFVMGAAFASVTTKFIDGIFMPLIALIFQVGDMANMKFLLKAAVVDATGKITTPESAIMYGSFLAAIINFIVIAFVMFILIKAINKTNKEVPAEVAAPSSTDTLLGNILEELKKGH